jgi:Spy/CpxP family protein refolding chaperone
MGSGMMGMGSGMMGPGRGGFGGMMGGMGSGMMGGMGSGYGGHGRLLYLQKTLGLTDEQVKTIYSAFSEARKGAIKKAAEIQVARIELQELLRAPKTDMTAVKEKLNEIAKLQTELALARIEKHEKVKSTLTPEQLKKFFQTYQGFMMGGSGPAASEEEDD